MCKNTHIQRAKSHPPAGTASDCGVVDRTRLAGKVVSVRSSRQQPYLKTPSNPNNSQACESQVNTLDENSRPTRNLRHKLHDSPEHRPCCVPYRTLQSNFGVPGASLPLLLGRSTHTRRIYSAPEPVSDGMLFPLDLTSLCPTPCTSRNRTFSSGSSSR